MKIIIFSLIAATILSLTSCDYYSYQYDNPPWYHSHQESFELRGTVLDADSMWALSSLLIELRPSEKADTLITFTDTNGYFSFQYKSRYGSSSTLILTDTSGFYAPFDTLLWFSGRDYNAGFREIFINL